MTEPIAIEGLAQFQRNLKTLSSDLPKALRVALNEAADLVVDDARPKIPRRSGRAARSLKARSTRTAVRVSGGGSRASYYPWLDFGGRVGRGRTGAKTGSVERPFLRDGRYIYKSYFKLKASGEFPQALSKALVKVAAQAGVEVE